MEINDEFRKTVLDFPKQFRVGLDAARGIKVRKPKNTSHLVICGMGGSSLPGALLYDLQHFDPRMNKKHLHVVVHKNYGLPVEAVNSNAVVIVTSYSGNTEEALSAYRESRKLNLPMFAITTGGKLAQLAEQDRIPLLKIPTGVQPRFAIGYQFGVLMGLVVKLGFFPPVFRKETHELEEYLLPKKILAIAKSVSTMFRRERTVPLIYGSPSLKAAAYSWKTNIHENVKLPASFHVFPELNHNELNAFTPLTEIHKDTFSRLFVVMLEDQNEHPRTKKRFRLTANIIKAAGIPVKLITIKGRNALTRIFTANLLGLAFSGMLAERLDIDPLPVPVIESFKKKLK